MEAFTAMDVCVCVLCLLGKVINCQCIIILALIGASVSEPPTHSVMHMNSVYCISVFLYVHNTIIYNCGVNLRSTFNC